MKPRKSAPAGSSDFELNLAPIIDCFTVLMTYLLATASFLALTSLEVSLSGTGDTAEPAERIPVALTLEILPGGALKLLARGEQGQVLEERSFEINATEPGGWSFSALTAAFQDFKGKWPDIHTLVIGAEDSV
ncbi:MAG: biopolymer transporter ExbD, partial [Bdellovibrionota bacterium]